MGHEAINLILFLPISLMKDFLKCNIFTMYYVTIYFNNYCCEPLMNHIDNCVETVKKIKYFEYLKMLKK